MVNIETLQVIIDVIDRFESDLDRLIAKLGEVETAARAVDDIRIDVDVHGERAIDRLLFKLGQLQAADMAVGDIDIGVRRSVGGGGGGGAVTALSGDQLSSLTRALSGLDKSISDSMRGLSIDADDASQAMRNISNSADKAADSFELGNLRMSDMHNAMAKIVPLLVVMIGALPALIGGLVALAAAALSAAVALAALGGIAALGLALERGGRGNLMEGLTEVASDVLDQFIDAFAPLAKRLSSLFSDAVDGLGRFFEALADEGAVLTNFADDARGFGEWVTSTLPSVFRDLIQFADATSDALGAVIGAMEGIDIFAVFASLLDDTLPSMMRMGAMIANMLDAIVGLSVGFIHVANAILAFLTVLINIITVGGMFEEEMGIIIASILAALTATLIWNSALVTMARTIAVKAITAVLGAIQAFTTYDVVAKLATLSTWQLTAAVGALAIAIAATGIGALAVILGTIGGAASIASSDVDSLTRSLQSLERQRSSMAKGRNPYADPDIHRGDIRGRSRFSGSKIEVNVHGNADDETLRTQMQNANYRLERPRRSK